MVPIDRSIAIQPSSESFRSRRTERRCPHRGTRDDATRRSENKPNPRDAIHPSPRTRNPKRAASRPSRPEPHPSMRRHPYPEDPNHSLRTHREPNARSSIDRSKRRTLTLLTDRRVIVTIVVAVDARHAACIIDIDIGIESIDRVLSSRSPVVVVVVPTTPRPPLGSDDRTLGPTPSFYLPPSTSMGVLTISTT